MNFVRGPARDQSFRIGNADWSILYNVTLNPTVISITVSRVATTREVDGNDAFAPEDIRTKGDRARRHIVRRHGHKVRLEEVNTGSREFENFREVGRRQLFHAHQTFRRVFQNVDRAVVAGVVNCITPRKRMYNSGESLFRFHEGFHRAAGERLNRGADGADGQRGEAGARSSREFHEGRAIDGGSAVNGKPDQCGQGLTQAIRHFLGNVAQGVVDCGCECQ